MKKKVGMVGVVLALAVGAQAAIIAGDVVGLDFGGDANPDPVNWNLLAAPGATLGSVVNTNGSALAGVGFSINNLPANDGENANSSISPNWPGIVDNAQNDAWFESNAGQWTLTFTGLDDSLTYDVTVGSYWTGGNAAQQENRNTGWQIGGTQLHTIAGVAAGDEVSPAADSAGSYVTFAGVSSSGGTLTISTWDFNGNTVSTLSALTLEAIPEPATLGMVAAFGGAILFIRRRMML